MTDTAGEDSTSSQARSLPVELTRLIQHVELNQSGWWEEALERLITVVLWLEGSATPSQVCTQLEDALGAKHLRHRIDDVMARLHAAGDIFEVQEECFKVSEEQARVLRSERDYVLGLEARLQDRLGAVFVDHDLPVQADEAWADFDGLFLEPMLDDLGARLYELLAGENADSSTHARSYGEMLKALDEKYGEGVRDALVQFLDPADPDVREYLLRRLNGQYAREAASVDASVLASLHDDSKKHPRLRLLLDTNFVLSALELHDNPENDGTHDLLALIRQVREHVTVELYVLPITIDETRHVLQDEIARLDSLVPSRSAAAAGLGAYGRGLTKRYLQAASEARSRSLTPESFFGPYATDTLTFLRERGIELYNESLDDLRMDQEVVDDLHAVQEVQKKRKAGPKSYETNIHDMVLWHFVDRHRPVRVESPIDAAYWLATLDYGLVNFDRRKRRIRKTDGPPVCMTPSSLIQLLRFWVPRDELLDKAIIGSIREPLLFLDFDRSAEAVTIRILRELSRFEAVDDLSEPLLRSVILNKTLRAELSQAEGLSLAESGQLIESAVVAEAKELEGQLVLLQAQRDETERRASDEVGTAAANVVALTEERKQLADRLREAETELQTARTGAEVLSKELASTKDSGAQTAAALRETEQRLSAHIEDVRLRDAKRQALGRFAALVSSLAALVVGALAAGLGFWLRHFFTNGWVPWIGVAFLALLAWLLVAELLASRSTGLRDERWVRRLRGSRRALLGFLVAVAVGLVTGAIVTSWK